MDNNDRSAALEKELRERTNPVFNTAKATVMNICLSGDEDARLLAERLGIDTGSVMRESEQKTVFGMANTAVLETRYRTMNALISALEMGTVLDIPCGYTPRALNKAFRDIHYIGCDLPAVIDEMGPAMGAMLAERGVKNKEFRSADATNYASLRSALDTVEGELCITTEGLVMYLSDSELAELCANIRSLLREFGGCWVTYDPESSSLTMATMKTIVGEEALKTMMTSWKALSDKSDLAVSIDLNVMNVSAFDYQNGVAKLTDYLRSMGLKAERIPVVRYMPELASIADLPEETKAALKKALEPLCIWKMTLDETYAPAQTASQGGGFAVDVKTAGGVMTIALRGRVDSMTAPDFLAAYEQAAAAEGRPEKIAVDASALEYISSAGLRALLIMIKAVGEGNLSVTGQNETVQAIFEQTGFADMIKS